MHAVDVDQIPDQSLLQQFLETPGHASPAHVLHHLDVALGTLEVQLDPSLAARLDQIVPPGSAVTNFFNNSGWMKS